MHATHFSATSCLTDQDHQSNCISVTLLAKKEAKQEEVGSTSSSGKRRTNEK